MPAYRYDRTTSTYSTAAGVPLSQSQLRDVRDAIADGFEAEAVALVAAWAAGTLTLAQWASAFAALIVVGVTAGFALGYGGVGALDVAALASIDLLIAAQATYAATFVREIVEQEMSAEAVAARARLYSGAIVLAEGTAHGERLGLQLPYFPADGGTPCVSRCRCWWEISEDDDTYFAVWHTVGDSNVCDGCIGRGRESSPFVQPKAAT